jgi:hypothetical protein
MDYFTFTTDDGAVHVLPFPFDLPLEEREAYMQAAIDAAATPPLSED